MTAQTATLTDFLLARIAEDEEAARACVDEEADVFEAHEDDADWHVSVKGGMHVANLGRTTWHGTGELARHIARHDPARVLAECEAKRRIVENHLRHEPGQGGYGASRHAVRLLSAVYADHPDFREEWRA